MATRVILGMGSNLGDRKAQLEYATSLLSTRVGPILESSSIYETEPFGEVRQPLFLNCCLALETERSPAEVLAACRLIEEALGRRSREKWGPREIDIDILLYGDRIIEQSSLVIPHPGIPERRFVLVPLAEIVPHFRHPILQKNMAQLLKECRDCSRVVMS